MPQWATIDQWKENHCYQVLISFVSQKGNSGTQSLLLHTRLRHNQVKLFLLETSSTMCSGVGFPSLPVSHCLVCRSSSLGFFLKVNNMPTSNGLGFCLQVDAFCLTFSLTINGKPSRLSSLSRSVFYVALVTFPCTWL